MDHKGFVREFEGAYQSHVEKNGALLKWYNNCEGEDWYTTI